MKLDPNEFVGLILKARGPRTTDLYLGGTPFDIPTCYYHDVTQ